MRAVIAEDMVLLREGIARVLATAGIDVVAEVGDARGLVGAVVATRPDVAIVDVPWNGILEGIKIAAMAECYEVNCAPHNFYGHLSTMMSAHFCAAIGNFRIMEIDIDDVPWKDEVVSPPTIEAGYLVMTDAPGWGVEVNEAAIRAHPPKR